MKNTYSSFEGQYRGSRELIKSRLQIYLPYVAKLLSQSSKPIVAIDLGCGRGEWIELLCEHGVKARGVDLDDSMLKESKNLNLDVAKKDTLAVLKEIPDESISVVSAFQLIEHLQFEVLADIVRESFRVLRPEGVLILETPNYENIDVSTKTFHFDPTHIAPIPYELLEYLIVSNGFANSIKLLINEDKEMNDQSYVSLHSVLFGAARDYAVIAQKAPQLAAVFEPVNNHLKSVKDLSNAFDNQIHRSNELLHSLNRVVQGLQGEIEYLKSQISILKFKDENQGDEH